MNNPNIELIEKKLALLEVYGSNKTAYSVVFGSGMGAIAAVLLSETRPGDIILAQESVYGATAELLLSIGKDHGRTVVLEPFEDPLAIRKAFEQNRPKLVYIESPSNPTLHCIDLKLIADLCREFNSVSAIDATFASPYLMQPLLHGFDYSVHSTTKYLNGHSTGLGGVVSSLHADRIKKQIRPWRKLAGAVASAFDAWLLNNGLKTLSMRMDRHSSNAMAIALWLEKHPAISKVYYPGLSSHPDHEIARRYMTQFSGVLSFELAGGLSAGKQFMRSVRFITLTATLGTPDTLVQHPASMSHSRVPKELRLKNGISDGLIRMSVGLENVDDILEDLNQALSSL